jgi:hypothetical protein
MRGTGRVFRRGRLWWIAYSRHGNEYRESSRSESESDACALLKLRLGAPDRKSVTLNQLISHPELLDVLGARDLQLLAADCRQALRILNAKLRSVR